MSSCVETASKSPRYEVREADLVKDRGYIKELWATKVTGAALGEEKLRWYYEDNPAGPGAIFLLYSTAEQRPVGVIGVAKRAFGNGDTRLTGGAIIDFVVDPAHRTIGPGLMLQRAAMRLMQDRVDFFFSIPNQRSGILRRKLGFDERRELRYLVCPINLEGYLPASIPRMLRRAVAFAYRACLSVASGLQSRPVQGSTGFAADFAADLSRRLNESDALIGDRSPTTLHWRLFEGPGKTEQIYCQRDEDGRALGYVAYTKSKSGKVGVVDFACAPGYSLVRLFAPLVRDLIAQQVVSIALEVDASGKSDMRALRWLGFHARGKSEIFLMHCEESAAKVGLERLCLTRYDRDS